MNGQPAEKDAGPNRCICGHWWVDHDGFGCLIVSECQCKRSMLAARDDSASDPS